MIKNLEKVIIELKKENSDANSDWEKSFIKDIERRMKLESFKGLSEKQMNIVVSAYKKAKSWKNDIDAPEGRIKVEGVIENVKYEQLFVKGDTYRGKNHIMNESRRMTVRDDRGFTINLGLSKDFMEKNGFSVESEQGWKPWGYSEWTNPSRSMKCKNCGCSYYKSTEAEEYPTRCINYCKEEHKYFKVNSDDEKEFIDSKKVDNLVNNGCKVSGEFGMEYSKQKLTSSEFEALVGKKFSVTVTLKQSKDNKKFAFGSRMGKDWSIK